MQSNFGLGVQMAHCTPLAMRMNLSKGSSSSIAQTVTDRLCIGRIWV